MKVFLTVDPAVGIEVRARMEGDGVIGDFSTLIKPGDSFGDVSFDELKRLGPGEHEVDPGEGDTTDEDQ
jgi:hypothetical protein